MKTQSINSHVEVTVRRPNGAVETVTLPGVRFINDKIFSQVRKDTKAAGRGDVLSYENVMKTVKAIEPSEYDRHEARMHNLMRNSYTK